jgi:hypothetical protein
MSACRMPVELEMTQTLLDSKLGSSFKFCFFLFNVHKDTLQEYLHYQQK